MTIENYIQAGLQHLGVYSETISDIIYFLALLVIIGMINWITHVLTRQWLARFVLKLTKRTATNWDDLMFSQRFFNRLGLLIAPIIIQIVFKEFEWTQFSFLMQLSTSGSRSPSCSSCRVFWTVSTGYTTVTR